MPMARRPVVMIPACPNSSTSASSRATKDGSTSGNVASVSNSVLPGRSTRARQNASGVPMSVAPTVVASAAAAMLLPMLLT